MHDAIANLPDAYYRMVPELLELDLPGEERIDCANCRMVGPRWNKTEGLSHFHPETRCCTYWPRLDNFLVGRLLREGGTGERLMLERLAHGKGIEAWGIDSSKAWEKGYDKMSGEFGQRLDLKCPYYVGGEFSCGIWANRISVCRTWFCAHDAGKRGERLWKKTKKMLLKIEIQLQAWCIRTGSPPPEDAEPAEFEAWYRWCADAVDWITDEELAELRSEKIEKHLDAIEVLSLDQEVHLPEGQLLPNVGDFHRNQGTVVLEGYSPYDNVETTYGIFAFISRLDGRPWRQALAEANAELDEPLTEDLIRELLRIEALTPEYQRSDMIMQVDHILLGPDHDPDD